jgi:hypothetical protein
MRLHSILILLLLPLFSTLQMSGADAKWTRLTSTDFEVFTAESAAEAKAAVMHLEMARDFFLAATHSHDPGRGRTRLVVFHSEGEYTNYRPAEAQTAKVYGRAPGSGPATVASLGLKGDVVDQIFREYAQLALDGSAPGLPYWFRAGLATVYSTIRPAADSVNIGSAPKSSYRNTGVSDISLPMLFDANRETILASREKGAIDFNDRGSIQSTLMASQDFAQASWMLVHMLMFQPEYRPKLGEFMRALAGGAEPGAAFEKVYGHPLSKVKADLGLYARQPGRIVLTVPFKFEKTPDPQIYPVTKEEQERMLKDLR